MKTAIKIGMMGLSIVLLAGCKEKSHQTEMPAPSISVAMPVVRDITLTKDYPGYLSSDRMVNLVARVNGYLQSSQLVPGAKVKKGDLIFVIEPEVYQNNVTQAEAALNTAKAQVKYARSNYERMKEAAKSQERSRQPNTGLAGRIDRSGNGSIHTQRRSGFENNPDQSGLLLYPGSLRRACHPGKL